MASYDLVVVGGGIAGLSAANHAAELGLKVLMLERGADERYLCNTRYSGGVLHVAFRSVKRPAGELAESVQAATHGHADPTLVATLAGGSGRRSTGCGTRARRSCA